MDKVFKRPAEVGDFVTGYEKGYHEVVAITPGCGCGFCYHLRRILSAKFTKGKGISTCDGAYIVKVDKEILLKQLGDYWKEASENVRKYL